MDGRNGRGKTRQTRNKHFFQCMIGPKNSRRNGEREREREEVVVESESDWDRMKSDSNNNQKSRDMKRKQWAS